MKTNFKKGITIMEVVISITVVLLLIYVILPSFKEYRNVQIIKNASENVVSVLNKAQSQSLASLDSSTYGVYFTSNKIILFKGGAYAQGEPDNVEVSIMDPAYISDVTLGGVSGSTGELYFERLTGEPSKIGTITVTLGSATKVVSVSSTGAISIN